MGRNKGSTEKLNINDAISQAVLNNDRQSKH